jgi:hypothetical protein
MTKTKKTPSTDYTISDAAKKVVKYIRVFNNVRNKCCHHTFNQLTKAHNCYEGNTQTECNPILCPLKG